MSNKFCLLLLLVPLACAHPEFAAIQASCDKAAADAASAGTQLTTMREDYAKLRVSYDRLMALVESEAHPPAPPPPDPKRKVESPSDGAPWRGPASARVSVVEFSDFQCPFCSRAQPTLKQVTERWPKDVRFSFRHLPLPFHDNAMAAAKAVEAARRQGKFWEMHDLLFQNQEHLDAKSLEAYARQLRLDVKLWMRDLDDPALQANISRDIDLASQVGAEGTPTFFVNGHIVQGAQPFEAFKGLVEAELVGAAQ